ncbi:uncharacterized protein LOC123548578 isoform X2 [Mercenaria mercenaria]|uniref:uncharacterized protein LOC123548578 isoform X2 n=1 Tax=Mercenaria mercenaria TaxID=6596 RepID=UPI00234E9E26|nr:uncharacterized protein LOC123548578 isoform X2 [Mercenaria mercenaria]
MSEQDIPRFRSAVAAAIAQGLDTSEAVTDLLYANVPLNEKFKLIDFCDLVRNNAQSAVSLKKLIQAMSILEKYARHLMKPAENRSNMWRHIKYSNNIFRERVDAIQGGKYIMYLMGYTENRPDGVAFPDGVEPNRDRILNLLTDLVQGRKELEIFLEGQHPKPGEIEQFLNPQLRASLEGDIVPSENVKTGSQPGMQGLVGSQQGMQGLVPDMSYVQNQLNPSLPATSMQSATNQLSQQFPQQTNPISMGARQKTTGSNMGQIPQYAEPNLPAVRSEVKQPYTNTSQLPQRMPDYAQDTYMQNFHAEQQGQGHMTRSDLQGQGYVGTNIQGHQQLARTDFQGQGQLGDAYIQGQGQLDGRNVQDQEQFAETYRQGQSQLSVTNLQGQGQLANRNIPGEGQTNQYYQDMQQRQKEEQQRMQEVEIPKEKYEVETKTPSIACDICGDNHAVVICKVCDNKQLCKGCDIKWHNHPKRQNHKLEYLHPALDNSRQMSHIPDLGKQTADPRIQGVTGGVPVPMYTMQQEQARQAQPGYSMQNPPQEPVRQAQPGYSLQSPVQRQQMNQSPVEQRSPNRDVLQTQYNMKTDQYNTLGQSSNVALPSPANSEHLNSHVPGTMPGSFMYTQPSMMGHMPGTMHYPVSSGIYQHGQHVPYAMTPQMIQGHVAQYPVGYMSNVYMQQQPQQMSMQGYLTPVASAGPDIQRAENTRSATLPRSSSSQAMSAAPVLVQNVRHSISSPKVSEPSETSNVSLNSTSSTSSGSELLPGIKAINNIERRHSKLEISIMTLKDDLKEWEEKINAIILQNPNFFQDEEYKNLNRKKRKHLQEINELQKYQAELEQLVAEKLRKEVREEKEKRENEVETLKRRFNQIKTGNNNQPAGSASDMYITPVSVEQMVPVTTASGPINSTGLVPAGPVTTTYRPQQLQKNAQSPAEQKYADENCPPLKLNSFGDELPEEIKKMLVLDQNPHAPRPQVPDDNLGMANQASAAQNVLLPPKVANDQNASKEAFYENMMGFKKGNSEPDLQQGVVAQNRSKIKKSQSSDDLPMWQCEHCTFLNDFDTKACTMCFKTSDNPKRIDPNMPTVSEEYPGGDNVTEICEYCTVFMEPGTKICGVCGKTQTKYQIADQKADTYYEAGNKNTGLEAGNQSGNRTSNAGNQSAGRKPSSGDQSPGRKPSAENQSVRDATEDSANAVAASTVGKLIEEEQDQVFLEKKAARERFEKMNKSPGGIVPAATGAGMQEGAAGAHAGNIIGVPKGTKYDIEPLKQEVIQEWIIVDKTSPKEPEQGNPQLAEKNLNPPNRDIAKLRKHSGQSSGSSSSYNSAASSLEENAETKAKANNQAAASGKGTKAPQLNFVEAIEQINLKREQEQMSLDGHEIMTILKEGERSGYEVLEVQIALKHSIENKLRPLDWLKTKWPELIDIVTTMATEKGKTADQNDVGDVSSQEAKQALIKSDGDIDKATQMCVEERIAKYAEINAHGQYAREDILTALYQNQGDIEEAVDQLNHSVVQSYADRLWDNNPNRGGDAAIAAAARSRELTNSVSNSVINHTDFQRLVSDTTINKERRVRMVFVEGKLKSWGRAEMVVTILDKEVTLSEHPLECTLEDIIEAVRNCGDRKSSLVYLTQECGICFSNFPMSKIRDLGACSCKLCQSCVKQYFEVAIREKYVRNWCCPLCEAPGLEDEARATSYFEFLSLILQNLVSKEVMELYEVKLRDWHLQKDPNFRWCAHCASGFIWDRPDVLGMACPSCHQKTCFMCKIKWEDQHEGLTCEEYEQWKIDNDPEKQAKGVKLYLEENGIDCPSCKMRYSLAKGGCMHFKCPQCGYEFCSGCSQAFLHQEACKLLKSCKDKGLHCHHPRDCFYYLRDSDTADLQKLLKDNKVRVNTEVPPTQEDREHCPVMEQKEYGPQKKDEPCGKDTKKGMAGLCEDHYKEYLVGLINKNKLDPLAMMTLPQMKILIERNEKEMPKPKQNEGEGAYKRRVYQFIKEKWQLHR